MKKTFGSALIQGIVILSTTMFVIGCSGGSNPPDNTCTTTTGQVAANCTVPTDTNTGTDTGTQTGTDTGTGTQTGTGTGTGTSTSTVPSWFKVNAYLTISMTNSFGSDYASFGGRLTTINNDGTFTILIGGCQGKCSGLAGTFTGTVTTNSIEMPLHTDAGLVGMIPGENGFLASGNWSYNTESGKFNIN